VSHLYTQAHAQIETEKRRVNPAAVYVGALALVAAGGTMVTFARCSGD
jgi:hypothetical protein